MAARANGSFGFNVPAPGHAIVRNSAGANTAGDYQILIPGNALGPIVTEADITTSTSPHANYQP